MVRQQQSSPAQQKLAAQTWQQILAAKLDNKTWQQNLATKLVSLNNNHLCSADSKAKSKEVKSPQGQHRPQQAYPKSTPPHIRADPHHVLLSIFRSQCLPQHMMTCNTRIVLCDVQPKLCMATPMARPYIARPVSSSG